MAIQLSLQKTQESILEQEGNTTSSALLDFTVHKLGAHTKIYQRNLKKAQNNCLNELKNQLNEKRDDPDTTEDEIMEIEKNVDEVLETICSQEAQKMETFRLLNDEKASKAMINLEKKITGYSNMSRMNKPNPDYIDPEKGGSKDEAVNPKKILLTDPIAVRRNMRYFMQDIYNKQEGLTREEEHVISFLGRDGDNKVLD